VQAWTEGEVPLLATNNYAVARQYAAILVEHVEALGRAGRLGSAEAVWVLEVGAGLGRFAANFLRALRGGLGERGRRIADRVRYVHSDYAASTVRQATGGSELKPLVASGQVVPALYDCRKPGRLTTLDGADLAVQAVLVQCNYVCCVLPTKYVAANESRWSELWVKADVDPAETADTQWRPLKKSSTLSQPPHAAILSGLVAAANPGSLAYPIGFLDFVAGATSLVLPEALFAVEDFGSFSLRQATSSSAPLLYGASLNHHVAFGVFDLFARETGRDLVRTAIPFDAIHHALLTASGTVGPEVRRRFTELFIERNAGQDFLDYIAVARKLLADGERDRAMRFLDRALSLDPYNPELYFLMGNACLKAGLGDLGVHYLSVGQSTDHWGAWDFTGALQKASQRS
jgi:hypothetical protein